MQLPTQSRLCTRSEGIDHHEEAPSSPTPGRPVIGYCPSADVVQIPVTKRRIPPQPRKKPALKARAGLLLSTTGPLPAAPALLIAPHCAKRRTALACNAQVGERAALERPHEIRVDQPLPVEGFYIVVTFLRG